METGVTHMTNTAAIAAQYIKTANRFYANRAKAAWVYNTESVPMDMYDAQLAAQEKEMVDALAALTPVLATMSKAEMAEMFAKAGA